MESKRPEDSNSERERTQRLRMSEVTRRGARGTVALMGAVILALILFALIVE